jgi:hypothetical protein
MGYIPALFVVFSGGLLWGIVVYNNLKTRLETLHKKLEKIRVTILERNASIQAVLTEAIPSEMGDFVDDPFVKVQSLEYNLDGRFLAEEGKVRIWLKDFIQKLKNQNFNQEELAYLTRSIAEADRALVDFSNFTKQYNSLVETKPTSFMASILGFKKINL